MHIIHYYLLHYIDISDDQETQESFFPVDHNADGGEWPPVERTGPIEWVEVQLHIRCQPSILLMITRLQKAREEFLKKKLSQESKDKVDFIVSLIKEMDETEKQYYRYCQNKQFEQIVGRE